MKKNILIGVAWPYVNGELHIGHLAGYLLPADIFSRYNRLIGNNVLMVSGSDCFGTPITIEADKRKLTPTDIATEYHAKDYDLFINVLNLTYDLYTQTNHENHIEVAQDIFVKLIENGYIFVDSTKQYYSPTEKRFLPDRYVVGKCPFCGFEDARSDQCDNCGKLIDHGQLINPRSNLTKEAVELKETQHYFLDWPKLQPFLEEYVKKNGPNWKDWVFQETLGWLKEGLQPRAITRDLDWGVPIPTDRIPADKQIEGVEHKRIYVWFDAVIGYLSASKLWAKNSGNIDAWKEFWYDNTVDVENKHYYFMGKDNLVFHTLFWPGQLMGYNKDLHLPDVNSINMFLNFDGKQFSKSRGVTINAKDIVEKYGNDAVRFYLTLIMPETRDSSFNWADFQEKINGILVANLGNFIHRSLSLSKGISSQEFSKLDTWLEVEEKITLSFDQARTALEKCEFRNYLEVILQLSSYGNGLVDREKPWELKTSNPERFVEVIKHLYLLVVALGYLMNPLMPTSSNKLLSDLGLKLLSLDKSVANKWPLIKTEVPEFNKLLSTIKLSETFAPLFTKLLELKK